MKHLIGFFIFILPNISFGQIDNFFIQNYFFQRQPSARAEAMGKGYSAMDGDLTSIFFNPAGIATIKGLEMNGSYSDLKRFPDRDRYTFGSVGFKLNDYLTVAVSRNRKRFQSFNSFSHFSNYTLTLASQPIKNLFLGLNANYFHLESSTLNAFYFDFGAIKKFELKQLERSAHSVNLGVSITNFNFGKVRAEDAGTVYTSNLPVITRYGVNYQYILKNSILNDSLNAFQFLLQAEYKTLLNSPSFSGIHTGAEFNFSELIALRMGYYRELIYGPFYNYNFIRKSFTFGLGLQLPLEKMTNLPWNLSFDYTRLPFYLPALKNFNWKNSFRVYNVRIIFFIR